MNFFPFPDFTDWTKVLLVVLVPDWNWFWIFSFEYTVSLFNCLISLLNQGVPSSLQNIVLLLFHVFFELILWILEPDSDLIPLWYFSFQVSVNVKDN